MNYESMDKLRKTIVDQSMRDAFAKVADVLLQRAQANLTSDPDAIISTESTFGNWAGATAREHWLLENQLNVSLAILEELKRMNGALRQSGLSDGL